MFMSYIVRFLSGHLHAMAIPDPTDLLDVDVPSLSDTADAFKDAIGEAFAQVVENIVQTINDKYLWLLESTLNLMGTIGIPPVEMFQKGPVSLLFGGVYGLSLNILRLVLVVVAFMMLITIARSRRAELGGRTMTSLLGMVLFVALFYPVYGFLTSLVRQSTVAIIDMIANVRGGSGSSFTGLVVPNDPFGAFVTAGIGSLIMFAVINEVAAMWMGTIVVAVGFPLSLVLRPLGKFGLAQFRVMMAMLVTTTVSLIPMSFFLGLGVLIVGVANKSSAVTSIPGMTSFISVVFTIVGGVLALLTPFVVYKAAHNKATEMFGNVDATMQNGLNILTMPPVSVKDVQSSQSRNRVAMLASFGAGVATSAVQSDKPATAVKGQLLNKASMVAHAAPDARVRAAAWAVDFGKMYMERRKNGRGGGE